MPFTQWNHSRNNPTGRFNHSNIETGGTPLRDLPRLSTETQRRNGYIQSDAPERSTRILEDISNGNYTCSICTDTIIPGNTREYGMWHCHECYNVFHFCCIEEWANSDGTRTILNLGGVWRCPYCQHESVTKPRATCWCGKESFDLNSVQATNPNACNSICDKLGPCPHGTDAKCQKGCHPGPCDWPCGATCVNLPLLPPTAWGILRKRFKNREQGRGRAFLCILAIFVMLYIGIGIFLSYYIDWHSKPFRYPDFNRGDEGIEFLIALLVGFILQSGTAVLALCWFMVSADILIVTFNLNDYATNRENKQLVKFFGGIFLASIFASIWFLPILGVAGGDEIAWYNQMKSSCKGFDTRINMDTLGRISGTKLEVWSTNPAVKSRDFYLGSHLKPILHSRDPFQYYQRLSGSASPTHHIAVDVDLHNGVWRLLHLNDTDEANKWIAHDRKSSTKHTTPPLPIFSPLSQTLIKNGTFTDIDLKTPHMHIPQLNMSISNMYQFIDSYDQEPFLRVFETAGLDDKSRDRLLGREWTPRKDTQRMVMRTASFGHGRQRLDMCVKEGEWVGVDGNKERGMDEGLFVPFAIVEVIRTQGLEKEESWRRNLGRSVRGGIKVLF